MDADRRPGRPRSARSEQSIITAVLEMIGSGAAIESLSIEAIAARAGVGKATIYRRWSSKEQLIHDAVASLKLPVPELAGECVRTDLVTLVSSVAREMPHGFGPVTSCLIPAINRSDELHGWYQQLIEPRREAIRSVLRRGVGAGEIRSDIDIEVTVLLLTGPMVLQRMVRWNPALDVPDLAVRIVDGVLAGAASTATATVGSATGTAGDRSDGTDGRTVDITP